jgi:hypothetical protein
MRSPFRREGGPHVAALHLPTDWSPGLLRWLCRGRGRLVAALRSLVARMHRTRLDARLAVLRERHAALAVRRRRRRGYRGGLVETAGRVGRHLLALLARMAESSASWRSCSASSASRCSSVRSSWSGAPSVMPPCASLLGRVVLRQTDFTRSGGRLHLHLRTTVRGSRRPGCPPSRMSAASRRSAMSRCASPFVATHSGQAWPTLSFGPFFGTSNQRSGRSVTHGDRHAAVVVGRHEGLQ